MTKISVYAVVIFCFFTFCCAEAAVFNVTNVTELQNALTTAQGNGEDDTINLAPGSYVVSSALNYMGEESENFSLTIQGGAGTVLDGGNATSILRIEQGYLSDGTNANVTIRGVTFQNGSESSMLGGALYIGNYYAQTTIEDSVFQDNTVVSGGGALYLNGWTSHLNRNTFTGNSSTDLSSVGGAAYVEISGGTLSLDGNAFINNSCAGGGAGLYAADSGAIVLTGNTFTSNVAGGEGGGAYLSAQFGGSLTLSGNAFRENSGSSSGGVSLASDTGPIVISGNIFRSNIASTSSESNGGGLTAYSQNLLKMVNNLFAGNTVSERGAGAMLHLFSNENPITNNTFVGNSSTGVYDQGSSQGAGMYVITDRNDAVLDIYNNIFWNNTAAAPSHGGADFYINDDGLNDKVGSTVNLYNNDYSNMEILRGGIHFFQGGNINADPMFDADYRLTPGSPCMDTGDNSAPGLAVTDLGGDPRIQDGKGSGTAIVDMGAYEWGPPRGLLQVTISPKGAIDAGAKWRLDGGDWQVSGYTQTVLVGSHTVEFSALAGWTKPGDQTVTIAKGETATVSGTYVQETGSLQVTITPAGAVDAGAKWRRAGTATWLESGATEPGIPAGPYTVEFGDVVSWTKPGNQTVTIIKGQTTALTGIYLFNPVSPAEGTIGTEFTIRGSGFGTKKGKVLIGGLSLTVLGWKDEEIQCRLGKALSPLVYNVTIVPNAGKTAIILKKAFEVKSPEMNSISESDGRAGDQITINGHFGGTKKGKVYLGYSVKGTPKVKSCSVVSWTMDATTGESVIVFVVPKGLASQKAYDIIVTNIVGSDTQQGGFTVD